MYKDKSSVGEPDEDVELIIDVGYIASRVRLLEEKFFGCIDLDVDTDSYSTLEAEENYNRNEDTCLGNIQRELNDFHCSHKSIYGNINSLSLDPRARRRLLENLLIQFYEDYERTKQENQVKSKDIMNNREDKSVKKENDNVKIKNKDDDNDNENGSTLKNPSDDDDDALLKNKQSQSNIVTDCGGTSSSTSTTGTTRTTTTTPTIVSSCDKDDGKEAKHNENIDETNKLQITNNNTNAIDNKSDDILEKNRNNDDGVVGDGDGNNGANNYTKNKVLSCAITTATAGINKNDQDVTAATSGGNNPIVPSSTSSDTSNNDGKDNEDHSNFSRSTKQGIISSSDECNLSCSKKATIYKSSAINDSNPDANAEGGGLNLVQLKNTIIQCQFNGDDLRALVRDLKRKIEYTERMNWLYSVNIGLSRRPMGPPHRKCSLPKHSEVKKRFLEICDKTFSDEVKAALRLPAFDSYEWEDADVIHLMQTMFIELGLIEKFNIPVGTLREWLYEVYKHYNEVPFHNFRHCFCVAQMMYAITRQANLISRLGELEVLILLVSCICHDLDHPGYNNIYQINARTELALRYNDISPLENHHCSIAFRLLEHPECNIFKNFNRETFNVIREGIIRCILATDMARHNEILTQFKDAVPNFDYSNRSHINLLCMVLIKVADISNEARPMNVAEPWLDRLLQEFFAQSAAEKSEGLPVTPFMDPDKISKPGSQVRFIGLVLLPLFEALGELLPELTELIIIPVRWALDYYKRLNDAQTKSRKSLAEANENSSDGGGGGGGGGSGGGGVGGGSSPQMPRSQSGISIKSRRSVPSQKSASRTSVDEPTCIAAELHDLPEGSESGDSETATEVDVAEKASKFKVDTEGSNRSKSSHSTSRKSSREKRPSMISEMCSSGGRMRNSYGNIHGYGSHANRGHFGSNRAVSLDQYSSNNRRLSDGLQQVISDSNVFYNRHNRSIDNEAVNAANLTERPKISNDGNSMITGEDVLNMNTANQYFGDNINKRRSTIVLPAINNRSNSSNISIVSGKGGVTGNNGGNDGGGRFGSGNYGDDNGVGGNDGGNGNCSQHHQNGKTWKARFKQLTDIFSFSFDKSNKRFIHSTRSSPCSIRNNNATTVAELSKPGICCTISNNLSPNLKHKQQQYHEQNILNVGRNRAYSLDVPSRTRYSSSSGGDSRKSSRNEESSIRQHDPLTEDNNSNNTSSGEVPSTHFKFGGSDIIVSQDVVSTLSTKALMTNNSGLDTDGGISNESGNNLINYCSSDNNGRNEIEVSVCGLINKTERKSSDNSETDRSTDNRPKI